MIYDLNFGIAAHHVCACACCTHTAAKWAPKALHLHCCLTCLPALRRLLWPPASRLGHLSCLVNNGAWGLLLSARAFAKHVAEVVILSIDSKSKAMLPSNY